ncbi:MAG: SDR family NAD(P)-dependent oxidoreductase [Deltaproteobacteria bacterium]|nr:SDR family NAD(P)-dependent oxidoreductase [Deltaproteobacteria bacterium]
MSESSTCVLITGGTRGLGRQFAFDLAAEGCRVGVCSSKTDSLEALGAEFQERGLALWTRQADVAKPDQVEDLFRAFVADHGRIDVLVNNAGITRDCLLIKRKPDGSVAKMPIENWKAVVDVNLTGVFLCGREAAVHMIEKGTRGTIVNISSVCRAGNIGQTAYSATKAGVVAMTVAWSKELARYGIRVASVAPGYVHTLMTEALRPDVRQKIESAIPAQRMASWEEISDALRFVLKNKYVSGRVIEVDGGLRI